MPKKLIEVALPLEAINEESSRRKRKAPGGYPTALHKWWAQRPLAACRAVLFASLVDDPSAHPEQFPTETDQDRERLRLFKIIEELVLWENSTNETVLNAARREIQKSTGGNPPPVLDPFCGGGSIPLEAQRLGLEAHGSDLNPVAVLITKALIEIPPRFAGQPPVHPGQSKTLLKQEPKGAAGLAADVRYYGKWMRDEAEKRIGHLYPKVKLPNEHGGGEATVIAWLWARTVASPNPACKGAQVPLIATRMLSTKEGRKVWVEIAMEPSATDGWCFQVKSGPIGKEHEAAAKLGTKAGKAKDFICALSRVPITRAYIQAEGKAGRLSTRLMAVVCQVGRGRNYLPPDDRSVAAVAEATKSPLVEEAKRSFLSGSTPTRAMITGGVCSAYGLSTWGDLFTDRQIVALTSFSDLVSEALERVMADARSAGLEDDGKQLANGGTGVTAYSDAVATYLAFMVSRLVDFGCTLSTWRPKDNAMRSAMAKHAFPMSWDFAEGSPFGDSSAGAEQCVKVVAECLFHVSPSAQGEASQADSATLAIQQSRPVISTDPPYYDNIGYAKLSDFFYSWLRRSLQRVYPKLLSTMMVPKAEELVATPYRFGGSKEKAEQFFEAGFAKAFGRMREHQDPDYPLTVYYAFKQAEEDDDADEEDDASTGRASTGWETMLEGLLKAGFSIDGTWPMRTEGDNRQVGIGANALASCIVIRVAAQLAAAAVGMEVAPPTPG